MKSSSVALLATAVSFCVMLDRRRASAFVVDPQKRVKTGTPTSASSHGALNMKLRRRRRGCGHDTIVSMKGHPLDGLVLPNRDDALGAESLGGPVVHRHGDGTWTMWYHGRGGGPDSMADTPLPPLSTGRIGVATSKDGLRWERQVSKSDSSFAVLKENSDDWWSFDSAHVGLGDVLPFRPCAGLDEAYRSFAGRAGAEPLAMYTFGGAVGETELRALGIDKDGSVAAMDLRIGLAVSQGDVATWARVEGEYPGGEIASVDDAESGVDDASLLKWDSTYLGWPCAVDTTRHGRLLYYHALDRRSNAHQIGVARGRADGVRFDKLSVDGPVEFSEESEETETVGPPVGSSRRRGGDDGDDADAAPLPPLDDSKGRSRRCVRPHPDGDAHGYYMWYEGLSARGEHAIGLAHSPDGLDNWTKRGLVFAPANSPDAWDNGVVSAPFVVKVSDPQESPARLRMYYAGGSKATPPGPAGRRLAIGAADSIDGGRTWTRVPSPLADDA